VNNGETLCRKHHNKFHRDCGYKNTAGQFEMWLQNFRSYPQ
jgi:hypothetical protein